MSTNTDNPGGEETTEIKLAREIRDLDNEIQPARDLWPAIERRIAGYPQRRAWKTQRWLPWGVAASLLIATTSLLLSLANDQTVTETVILTPALDNMQAEYTRVRDPMLEEFNQTNQSLDPDTLEEIYRNIEIMSKARGEIESQIRENPESRYLIDMLMRVNQQEMDLLREDYTRAARSM